MRPTCPSSRRHRIDAIRKNTSDSANSRQIERKRSIWRGLVSAPPLESDQFDQQKNFKKKTFESGRLDDGCTLDPAVSFQKRGLDRKDFAKVPPRRPAGRRRIRRTESQWSFPKSDPAALPGSCAGNCSRGSFVFEKRPQGRALEIPRFHFMKFLTRSQKSK